MPKRYGTFVSFILDALDLSVPLVPLESPFDFVKRQKRKKIEYEKYKQALWYMSRKGYLKIVNKNTKQFIEITKKGQLEKLLQKAEVSKEVKWDGKWRVLIFDIPEVSREKRDQFRWLLKHNNFIKLQASVFISPYSLNREAIAYLKETRLMDFIRILKVEEIDSDLDLRKKFGLHSSRP